MRQIIFKNLTSPDRRKKIIVNNELFEKSGVRTSISRHLICLVRKVNPQEKIIQPVPYLYILKECNHQKQLERFIFRFKGSIYTISGDNLYLITFLHSLKIHMNVLNRQPFGAKTNQ
ncbi:MAG: hypothetical protein NC826_01950 [Candidatus Omnitrophica bacterium]|nr:hypothetical protein [Candidatus Omnitrophota bacterium]